MASVIGFNYEAIENAGVRTMAQGHAEEIHAILERTTSGIIEIGRRLIQVHAVLGRDFGAWIRAEFRWSQAQASNFELAAEKFGHLKCLDQFQPTALFALLPKNVEQPAIREAIKLAERGEMVTRKTAKKLIMKYAKPGAIAAAPDPVLRLRSLVHRFMRELPNEQRQQLVDELTELVDELRGSLGGSPNVDRPKPMATRRRAAAVPA